MHFGVSLFEKLPAHIQYLLVQRAIGVLITARIQGSQNDVRLVAPIALDQQYRTTALTYERPVRCPLQTALCGRVPVGGFHHAIHVVPLGGVDYCTIPVFLPLNLNGYGYALISQWLNGGRQNMLLSGNSLFNLGVLAFTSR